MLPPPLSGLRAAAAPRVKVTTPLQGACEGISSVGCFISFGRLPGGWLWGIRWDSKMGFQPIGKDLGLLVLAKALGAVFPDKGE